MLKWRTAWDSPGSGRRQVSHIEMDEDVGSVSKAPSSPGFFFFFKSHRYLVTLEMERRVQGSNHVLPRPQIGFSASFLAPGNPLTKHLAARKHFVK